jgi:hypothetical protein
MAINFDRLPQERPEGGGNYPLLEPGIHEVTIEEASMKTAASGSQYLEIVLKLKKGGKVWDKIMDSDKPALQYKLSRFLRACRIPPVGEMELPDLATLVKGRTFFTDIINKENTWNGKTTTRPEVDLFTGGVFYLPEDLDGVDTTSTPAVDTNSSY